MLCPQLCIGSSRRRYIEIGLFAAPHRDGQELLRLVLRLRQHCVGFQEISLVLFGLSVEPQVLCAQNLNPGAYTRSLFRSM
jgi:hypothetical protein